MRLFACQAGRNIEKAFFIHAIHNREEYSIMKSSTKDFIKTHGRVVLMVIVGSLIYSLGMNLFYINAKLLSGGVTGFAQLLNYQFGLPISVMVIALNIPLFLIGWKFVSKKFFLYSLMGMGIFSLALEVFRGISIPYDSLLTSVGLGPILTGLGLGIIYRSGASTGGSDIIAKVIHKYFSINMATTGLAINAVIVMIASLIYGLDQAVITLIAMFISAKANSYVIDGVDHRRAITIITNKPKEVADGLMAGIARGVTVTKGYGAYSGEDRYVLYCVIAKTQLAPLKRIVKEADPHAFFTITMVTGVYGHGHSFISLEHLE